MRMETEPRVRELSLFFMSHVQGTTFPTFVLINLLQPNTLRLHIVRMHESKHAVLPAGIVEWDSARTAVAKKKDRRTMTAHAKAAAKKRLQQVLKRPSAQKKPASKVAVHAGRLLLGAHRSSKQKILLPLPNKRTEKHAPGPPESKEEIIGWLKKKTDPARHVVGSDASKGLRSAFKEIGVEQATAKHSQSEYTPVRKLNIKNVAKRALKRMKGACKVSKQTISLVGGDQHCESLASSVKRSLRRAGKLGKNGARLQGSHIDPLGLYYLSQHPGLDNVAKAFKDYRESVEDRIAPGSAFQDTSWLNAD